MWMDYVQNGMSKDEREWIRKTWKEMDKDGDGTLDRREWRNAYESGTKLEKEMFGEEESSDFSEGDRDFIWLMANSVKN